MIARAPSRCAGRIGRAILLCAIGFVIGVPSTERTVLAATELFTLDGAPVTLSGKLRSREEVWSWFGPGGVASARDDNRYHFLGSYFRLGIGYERKGLRVFAQLSVPFLVNLPDDAAAPPPQGGLGLGATYFKPNQGSNQASVYLKQGFVEFGREMLHGFAFKGGRFEFFDGGEFMPRDAELKWIVNHRIKQRLVGPFGWSHVSRSFDGAILSYGGRGFSGTVMYAVPTKGAFDLQAMDEIRKTDLIYASLNAGPELLPGNSIFRLFYIYYHDGRGLAPVDNRPSAARAADRRGIEIHTMGVDYAGTIPLGPGIADFLVWGGGQLGSWGRLKHEAYAALIEGGYRLTAVRFKPWVRFGYTTTSGDGDPNDSTHGTFFQILPTPRPYARFPFFNMMNLNDAMGELILAPAPGVAIDASIHGLWLSSSRDLWYAGGGAFDNKIFGFGGRPSFGRSYLGTLADLQLNWRMSDHLSTTLYYAHAFGGSVIAANFPAGRESDYGYIEVTLSF